MNLDEVAKALVASEENAPTFGELLQPGQAVSFSIAGVQGEQGPKGDQGPEGPEGPQGEEGPQGPQGPLGPDGVPGDRGQDGKDGKDGKQGPKGDPGRDGKDGREGVDGKDGAPGTTVVRQGRGGGGGTGGMSLSNVLPLVESGSGNAGTSQAASRGDHVHPADGGGGGGAVDSVNGQTGVVVLDAGDVSAAPDDATYLVTTAHAGLSAEVAVGTSPGGELGGTWASPTVDATHSGSTHAAIQAAAEATAAADVDAHEADTTSVHGIANTANLYVAGGTDVAVADGGTGASTAGGARTNLGLVIGTDVPAQATFDDHSARHENGGADEISVAGLSGLLADAQTPLTTVATDAIWDAAGDLAVGSGANTAARLAIGAAGGHISRINGAVAWNSGTSNPGAAAAGDRYWRTDLGLEIYFDGTRWLTTQLFEFTGTAANASASADFGYFPPLNSVDMWLVDFRWTYQIGATHNGSLYWTATCYKYDGTTDAVVVTLTSDQSSTAWVNPAPTAIGALLGTTNELIHFTIAKVSTPGNINCGATLRYRRVVT